MTARTTYNGSSTPPLSGVNLLNEYAARIKNLYDQSAIHLTGVAGTANAVTAVLDPVLDSGGLVDGMKFSLLWAAANSAGVTLSLNGAAAVAVLDNQGAALPAGAIAANLLSVVEYLAGSFRVLTPLLAGSSMAAAQKYYQRITATQTWNKPPGFSADSIVWVALIGGGGSGRSQTANANGGGGGGYILAGFRYGDLPSSLTVTIGAGGAAVTSNPGLPGGDTSFGALLAALGGLGGLNSAVVTPGGGSTVGSTPIVGGVAEDGGDGGACVSTSVAPQSGFSTQNAGAGGGSGNGNTASASVPGGISKFGGDGGVGGDSSPIPVAGTIPGGGGGASQSGGTASGAGARGEAVIYI